MPKAIWSGAISFGMVSVPVKLTTAIRKHDVRFHQLHRDDGARIEQRRFCTADGEEVAYHDLVKGYEIGPGRHVVVTPEELQALDPEASRTIEILDFVDEADIDPVYYQHAYYLVPDNQPSKKPYVLLREALERSGRVGIARFVMRNKEYLAVLRAVEGALLLSTMLYHDELVPAGAVEGIPDDVDVDDRELQMAQQLIDSMATDFDPERYKDRHRERVVGMLEAKAKGEEVVTQPETEEEAAGVVDLVAALEASLEEAEGRRESA